jgi:hypothetical protein
MREFREAAAELELVLADDSTPANILELARALQRRLGTLAGRLMVTLTAEAQGAEVTLDGEVVPAERLSREIIVAPGNHTVAVLRDGTAVSEAEVAVRAGEVSRIRLGMAGAVQVPAEEPDEPDEPDEPVAPPRSVPIHEEWGFWLGLGIGVAAVAVAVALIVVFVVPATSEQPGEIVPGNFMPGVITW